MDGVRRLQSKLASNGKSVVLLLEEGNLVDKVWGAARSSPPSTPLRVHPIQWAGQSVASKLQELRSSLSASNIHSMVISMLDEVAWLYNLRGSDVECNPVFLSYALVSQTGAYLYVQPGKVPPEVAAHLAEAGVEVRDYNRMTADVHERGAAGE